MIKYYYAFFILFLVACGNPINIETQSVKSVLISGDQLIVAGDRFKNIQAMTLSHPESGFNKPFDIASVTESKIIGVAIDNKKIPLPSLMNLVIDSARGQSVYPVSFSLQNNAVTNPTIQNGAITPEKFKGVLTTNPPDQTVLTWSQLTQKFLFTTVSGGGGGSGVSQIVLGPGIVGSPNSASGTVPVSVNIGEAGDSGDIFIPYFNNNSEIVLDNTSVPTKLVLKDGSNNFLLRNDNSLKIAYNDGTSPDSDFLIINNDGKVEIKDSLYVGGKQVCDFSGTGCPSSVVGIANITATPPLIASAPASSTVNISASVGINPGQLVQLGPGSSLPAVDGSALLNIVKSVIADPPLTASTTAGTVTMGIPPAPVGFSLFPPALTDISNIGYPPVTGGVIIGDGSKYVLESGPTFRSSVGLAIGTDVQAQNNNLQQISALGQAGNSFLTSNGANFNLSSIPNCGPSGHLVAGDGNTLNCSDNTFVFKLKETQYFETSGPGTNYVAFVAPATIATNITWALPAADGTSGQVLTTNGSGGLSWGSGNGDVKGPFSSLFRNVAIFADTTGKAITDSNILIDNLVSRNATPVIPGNLPSYNGTMGNIIQDSGIVAANVVTNSGASPAGNLSAFSGIGKAILDSLIPSANVVTMGTPGTGNYVLGSALGLKTATESNLLILDVPSMSVPATSSNTIILSSGADKKLKSSPYTIPPNICLNGQILKSDGINFICGDSASPVISVFTRTGAVTAQAGDYNADQVTNTALGNISAIDVQTAINELDSEKLSLAGGTMSGTIITTTQNAIQLGPSGELHFLELAGSNYVGLKAPDNVGTNTIWILPGADGASGTVLTTNGNKQLSWTSASGSGLGDVTGPASSTSTHLASFNGTTGKSIQDSGILSANVMTMNSPALMGNILTTAGGKSAADSGVALTSLLTGPANSLAGGPAVYQDTTGKVLANVPYTIPAVTGNSGQVLTTDGLGSTSWSTGGVVGPATSTMNNLASFSDGAGNIKDSGLNALNIPTMVSAGALNRPILSANSAKELVAAPYTFPGLDGLDGQVLATNGGGSVSWQDPGDVVGPASSTDSNLAAYNGISGKIIQDSGIKSGNLPIMTSPALGSNQVVISAGANKELSTTLYQIPSIIGGAGTVLKSDGTSAFWLPDASNLGDVVGPANSPDGGVVAFDGITGKLIKDSGLLFTNIPTMVATATTGHLLQSSGAKTLSDSNIIADDVITKASNFTAANRVVLAGGNDKTLSETEYSIPITVCGSGQGLTSDGANFVCSTPALGDVAGPGSSTSGNLVSFNGISGKQIQDTGIIAANVITHASTAIDTAVPRFSGSGGKIIQNSAVTIDDSANLVASGFVAPTFTLLSNTDNSANSGQIKLMESSNDYGYILQHDSTNDRLKFVGQTTAGTFNDKVFFPITGSLVLEAQGDVSLTGALTINNNPTNSSTFPTDRGTSGQVLTTDGTGGLSWTTPVPPSSVNAQTGTTYALASGDCGNTVTLSNASAIAVSIPDLSTGCRVDLIQLAAGVVTVSGTGGMVLYNSFGLFSTRTQYSVITVTQLTPTIAVVSGDVN